MGRVGVVTVPLTSTKIKHYKSWNTNLGMFQIPQPGGRKRTPPIFANLTKITTWDDKNSKGDFKNVKIEPAKGDFLKSLVPPTHVSFQAAKSFHEALIKGEAIIAHDTAADGGGGGGGADEGASPI